MSGQNSGAEGALRSDFEASRVRVFLYENSIFLVAGAACALLWANFANASYLHFVEFNIANAFGDTKSHHQTGHHGFTMHFLVNDVLMAFFFAIAAKEVWEACLPGGGLSCIKKAATPLIAMLGGLIGPASIYLLAALAVGGFNTFGQGWAIPCATDIAFSYLIARLLFGPGHAAISFLLLLAIADDAVGLVILATLYPTHDTNITWLLLTVASMLAAYGLRRSGVHNFWIYLLVPGSLSWLSLYCAGIHPALGLVPIIPFMPHAAADKGVFANGESTQRDTLNQFEHWWKHPVELILGLFALVNAGVVISSFGTGTTLILLGLFVGKPLGISLATLIAVRFLGLELPKGMDFRDAVLLGFTASLGFTVALFVSTAAFPNPGIIQDSIKMGALLSFLAAPVAFIVALALGKWPACFGNRKPIEVKNLTGAIK